MRSEAAAVSGEGLMDPLAGRRVLVLISGSIAAVKLPLVVSALVQRGALVRCVLSPSAERLVSAVALASLSRSPCHIESDQWSHQAPRPLHIELAEWAEVVLLAPLSATSLARWVQGLADTLLASTLIACEAPVLAAPAMNSAMWAAPAVRRNWRELQGWERVLPLEPGSGLLACDRVGDGRMAAPELLLLALESVLLAGCRRDWQGRRLLVSAGPTREPLDPARCLTNPSTGRMGVLLAQAARLRGASVDLVHGPLTVAPEWLEGLRCHPASTAAAMQAALERLQGGADAIAMAAAVADHRRSAPERSKLPKQDLEASLSGGWEAVPDLLAGLVQRRPPAQAILGFAAQSGEVLQEARAKFARKGCDLLFANPIDRARAGFAATSNEGWLLGPGERQRRVAPTGKLALAHELLSALAEVMALRAPVPVPADP
ncbi:MULTISPECIES: bifunctional phosphopantothenoylcysteine decarboxylase/phosphopantothenate--cysteine ligase CoaBC [unclassified Cyanobium]|uniref:bifunctional phosphopantothenoylcysteine decarboxylase/phosphopantothenate--cysteine ligase CoaBC n=1 Tax=unclassified Cyanobium TaxID=2627006 RepID=UPI0020CBF076|nr:MULTISPECIES: bifunctional phosphopantothenoylcysteine decarboxylase/phosphopantothenate--cysteine ligase CoaBC [unclassified Cyanobium]MCP9835807.1 bifunctional phosphopantothenoylcysteine decarboxylase/phosphopantothenate--cysteine ligase CoaBC [Cyanobium sp. La Preciosa 7G6]MCP9938573.1 bifunctional phosphopantothenoylcysteine decarboxylase/phosphopantothenate--cysteine ligase CoaBC [Cyanobium sp. Aljojuca 7A6]